MDPIKSLKNEITALKKEIKLLKSARKSVKVNDDEKSAHLESNPVPDGF
jgi:hypothetical protein